MMRNIFPLIINEFSDPKSYHEYSNRIFMDFTYFRILSSKVQPKLFKLKLCFIFYGCNNFLKFVFKKGKL